MKKIFFGLSALMLSLTVAQAQSITPRVEAGLNVANSTYKYGNRVENTKALPGFRIGAAAEFALPVNLGLPGSSLYVTPGLNFNQQGNKITEDGRTDKTRFSYLSLPINIGARFGLDKKTAISIEVGPSFSYALSGKSIYTEDDRKTETDLFKKEEGETKPYAKRFDVGLGISAAAEVSQFYLRVGYDLGLTNLVNNQGERSDDKASLKNRSFFIGLGYRF